MASSEKGSGKKKKKEAGAGMRHLASSLLLSQTWAWAVQKNLTPLSSSMPLLLGRKKEKEKGQLHGGSGGRGIRVGSGGL